MAHDIENLWKILRAQAVGGGFSADPDWAATNDVTAFIDDSDPHWYKSGRGLELALAHGNAPMAPIPGLVNTTVEIELVELIRLRDTAGADFLYRRASVTLVGAGIWRLPEPVAYSELGVRWVSAANLPAANRLAVIGRVI